MRWLVSALLFGLAGSNTLNAEVRSDSKVALARMIVSKLESSAGAVSARGGWRLRPTKGLALDVGCGDASLAIEVAKLTGLKIRCIDPDAAAIEQARKAIDSAGLYGTRVSAVRGSLTKLAYPSYAASLIVCGDEFERGKRGRNFREIFRVLNPNGVAFIGQSAAAARRAERRLSKQQLEGWLKAADITSYEIVEADGLWARIIRLPSPGWDEWRHRSHDPAGTYASRDQLAGPEFKLLWASAPQPGLASAAILVAGGRLIEIGRGYAQRPDTTPYIQVSDAFTGIRLWSKVGRKQLPIERPLRDYSPIRSCSDIAVAGQNLYVLGRRSCHVFDLETGQERPPIPIPPRARPGYDDIWLYLTCVGESVFGSIGPSPKHQLRGFSGWGGTHWRQVSKCIFALDRRTKKLQWLSRTPAETSSIVIGDGRMLFLDPNKTIRCLDVKTGQTSWSARTELPAEGRITHCAYYRGKFWVMYSSDADTSSKARDRGWKLAVFSAADGKLLHEPELEWPVASMTFSDGRVFLSPQHAKGQIHSLDADTAELKERMLRGPSGSKCTPIVATPRWLFYRHRAGSGFVRIDRKTKRRYVYDSIRCSCHHPGLPANGLLYVQGPGCNCAHPFRANIALISGQRSVLVPKKLDERLVKGEAFGRAPQQPDRGAWATWRMDCTRAGKTKQSPAFPIRGLWAEKLPGKLTPVVAANGMVLCGSTDHKLYALDAETGKPRWQYIADGRIRVCPYWWLGRIYFGDDGGWVHCLRADDGKLVWKFRAALGEERVVAYEDIMSPWPAGNGALVHKGVAYFTAGFFPGEGGCLYAVDAATGKVLWTKQRMRRRRGVDCTFGAMAMGQTVLFMPTVGGAPLGVHLDDANHKPYFNLSWMGAFSPRGNLVMALGDKVIVGSPDLQYIHHVTTYHDLRKALPVVTDDAIYMREGRFLTAEKRSAYKVHRKRGEFTYVQSTLAKRVRSSPEPSDLLWQAWEGVAMTCIIKASDTVFTGADGKVHATRAADGKELWVAPVPGKVTDLAFHDKRLFVVTDAGSLACFGPERGKGAE